MQHKTEYDITQLWPIALVILVLGIGLAFSLEIVDDISSDFVASETVTATCNASSGIITGCSGAVNATTDTLGSLAKFGDKIGTIVTIVIAVIIIGLVRLFGAQR